MNLVQKMKLDWDRRAGHHARYWIATEDYQDNEAFARSGRETAGRLLGLLAPDPRPSWKALEIGCGIGRVLRPLSPHFERLYGVDVSAEMIAQSKEYLRGLPHVETFENTGVDLSRFGAGELDLVYSYVAFQHMPRPVLDAYLAEVQRVLKDRGLLAFQIYLGPRQDPRPGDTITLRVYDEDELLQKLEERGLQLLRKEKEHRTAAGLESWLLLARKVRAPDRGVATSLLSLDCGNDRAPLDEYLYLRLARRYEDQGRASEAIDTLRALVDFNPGHLGAWLDRVRLLVEQGSLDEAIEALTALVEAHPHCGEAYLHLIRLLGLRGRKGDAARVFLRLDSLREAVGADAIEEARSLLMQHRS